MQSSLQSSKFRKGIGKKKLPLLYSQIVSGYADSGTDNGAKLEECEVQNEDLLRIFRETHKLPLDQTLLWIKGHSDEFGPGTAILTTDNPEDLDVNPESKRDLAVICNYLNCLYSLDTYLNKVNESLCQGGYMMCHCRTSGLRKQIIMKKYPAGISTIVYIGDYLWNRVTPKIFFTRKFYCSIAGENKWIFSRAEALGRICKAGFEVIDEQYRFSDLFIVARKVKGPDWAKGPTGSPLIRLPRVGKDGKMFNVFKIRTMYPYSEYLQGYVYKHNSLKEGGKFSKDFRINYWGSFLRKTWLDETPMLINVLRGQMKIVGVRPLSRQYFSLYKPEMQELRTKVKPGMLPPYYAEKQTPSSIEDVQASEKKYLEAYLSHPFRTDFVYFWKVVANILFRGKKSS